MGHRGKLQGGDEWDAFSDWRKGLGGKAGKWKSVKRGYNKRMRKLARVEYEKFL